MSKAVEGAALLAGAVGMGVAAFLDPALLASPLFDKIWAGMIVSGIAMEAGALAQALIGNRGSGITTRQPAAFRQIIYGEQRVGGVMVYESTTGSHYDQYNMIIVIATHEIDSIVNLYLDGRQVVWDEGSAGNVTRNGVNFGGSAGGGTQIGPSGAHYDFDTLVFCEARFGDQANGDVISAITANDPTWSTTGSGSPYLGGCTYVYLKVEYDAAMFPQQPEVRFTVRGKNNIADPRLTSVASTIAGSVTSGTFTSGETVIQTGSGASANLTTTVPTDGPMTVGVVTGTPDATDVWVGQISSAVFTPTALPVAVPAGTPPSALASPTVLTNGWAANAQNAAYEEGVDQGYEWGLNSAPTPGYVTPNLAFDGNLLTSANISFQHTHQYAGCIWSFAALAGGTPTALWLNVNSMVNPYSYSGRSAGIWFSIDGGTSWTQVYNTPNHAQLWDCVELSPTQDCSQVQVMAFTDAHDDMAHFVYEIQLADGPQINAAANGGVFTTNWALVVADVLAGDQWGLSDVGSVNQEQLIAAANVCDEQIALAEGGTEAQWTCNWHYDTGTGPGDVLQTMMPAAAGRLSRIGGEWFIWPAYWQGPTFTFDDSILSGGVKWQPYRKQRELFNRVNGTYIAPNYPYNVAGNLYDANGWYYGTQQNNFPFAFQPTNYPQYACDALHGYGQDIYLLQDGGVQLPKELVQNCVLSVAQSQRAAKVALLRNRQQGSGSLSMNLEAWQMQPLDVMLLSFTGQSWVNKQLEIVSTKFTIDKDSGDTPSVRYSCNIQETDSSVYEWSTTEELSVYDVPGNPQVGPSYIVAPPTSLTLASNATTAVIGVDGSVMPRILVSWASAADAQVVSYSIQYRVAGATSWLDAPPVSALQTNAYISGVISGTTYNVQVQAVRNNGAVSAWTEGSVTVNAPNNAVNNYSNTPALALANPSSTSVGVEAVSVAYNGSGVPYSARKFTISTPTEPTWYYVTVADSLQEGDSASINSAASSNVIAALVQSNTNLGASTTTPFPQNPCSFTQNVTKGNLLVVALMGNGSGPYVVDSDTLGTTYTQITSNGTDTSAAGQSISIFVGIAPTSGANSVSWLNSSSVDFPAGFGAIAVFEFSGVSNIVDATAKTYNEASTIQNPSATMTTTQAGDVLMVFGYLWNVYGYPATFEAGAGLAIATSMPGAAPTGAAPSQPFTAAWGQVSGTGSQTASISFTGNTGEGATLLAIALKPAGLPSTCQTSDALVGETGNVYIGAIQVTPDGGSTNVLAGGWPAPTTFTVGA